MRKRENKCHCTIEFIHNLGTLQYLGLLEKMA